MDLKGCVRQCAWLAPQCVAFNFFSSTGTCELFASTVGGRLFVSHDSEFCQLANLNSGQPLSPSSPPPGGGGSQQGMGGVNGGNSSPGSVDPTTSGFGLAFFLPLGLGVAATM